MYSRHDTRSPFAVGLVTHDCFARTHRSYELRRKPDTELHRRPRTGVARQRAAILRVRPAQRLLADLRERARRAPRARLPERLVHALRPRSRGAQLARVSM